MPASSSSSVSSPALYQHCTTKYDHVDLKVMNHEQTELTRGLCRSLAEGLHKELEGSQRQKAALAEQLGAAKQDLNTAACKINDLSNASATTSSLLESVTSHMAELQNDLDEVRQASEEQRSAQARKLADLQSEGENLLEAMQRKHDVELQEKLETASDLPGELQTEFKQANEEVRQLHEQLRGLKEGESPLRAPIKAPEEVTAEQLKTVMESHQQGSRSSQEASVEPSTRSVMPCLQGSSATSIEEAGQLGSSTANLGQQSASSKPGASASSTPGPANAEIFQLRMMVVSLRHELKNANQAAAAGDKAETIKKVNTAYVNQESAPASDQLQASNMRIDLPSRQLQQARDDSTSSASSSRLPSKDAATQVRANLQSVRHLELHGCLRSMLDR